MKRNDFGLWGLELPPEGFAMALAALGVFQGTIESWPGSLNVETVQRALSKAAAESKGLLGWRLSVVPPGELGKLKTRRTAHLFAQAWEVFIKSHKGTLRFELHLDRVEDYFWIAGQLLSPAVKNLSPEEQQQQPHKIAPTALYVRADEPQTAVGWNWPLRIGFLKGQDSQRLRQQLEQAFKPSSLKQLVDFVDLLSEGDDCDLLLLPQELRGALSLMLKEKWRPKADCVLVLGGSKDLSGQAAALLHAVRTQARTSGVGLLFIEAERRGEWFKGLVAELSHDNPLDVALFNVNREVEAPTPLLAASRSLIELTLVSRTAARIGQMLKRRVAETSLPPPPKPLRSRRPLYPKRPAGFKSRNGGGGGHMAGFRRAVKKNGGSHLPTATRARALEVAEELGREHSRDQYKYESGTATDVARRSRDAESLIKDIPQKIEDRRIQAQVFDSPGDKQQRGALKPDAAYAVDVRIGPLSTKWESAPEKFPVEKLPPSETGHHLTVFFTEPRVSPDPQFGKLFLPPSGATAPCRFYFHTGQALDHIRARITVLHRNRVIQTAILDAPVATSGKAKKGRIKVDIEARVLPDINDLRRRQTFDAALVLNHSSEGQPMAMAVSGEEADMFPIDDTSFKQTIDALNGELTNLANAGDFPKDISAKRTTELLNKLASHGRLLHKYLFGLRREGQWLLDKDKKKIQIISTRPESNLPLEFLYDYEAPNLNAKLCAFAKKSLPTGECDKACGGPKKRKTIVCPLGFWGLNRVIERHTYDEKIKLKGTFGLKAAASSQRQPLQVLDKALFAASEKVDEGDNKGTIKKVEKVLKEKTKHTDYVMSWKEWAAKIKTTSPSLLLLLSHTEVGEQEGNMASLEIGKLPRLRVVDIEEKYVRKPGSKARPLVMLIGCSTHAPENPLESFVPFFGAHASIVLSTGSTVLALQAAEVAMEFIRTLSKLSGKPGGSTFGDVMLDVRRRLLARGLPMVLCLEAYGDADWQLE
ncbi:MAG: hypothetical protein QOH25_1139 [Acidobacteriota bacterium]|jgi:hypothetical protein|nr:hypothetical protein [Acidobacteriota bacterium]